MINLLIKQEDRFVFCRFLTIGVEYPPNIGAPFVRTSGIILIPTENELVKIRVHLNVVEVVVRIRKSILYSNCGFSGRQKFKLLQEHHIINLYILLVQENGHSCIIWKSLSLLSSDPLFEFTSTYLVLPRLGLHLDFHHFPESQPLFHKNKQAAQEGAFYKILWTGARTKTKQLNVSCLLPFLS